MELEQITYETDSSIIDKLYQETPIIEVGSIEDFLKLPVNDKYKKTKEQKDQSLDFNIKFNEISKPKIIIQE